MTVERQTVTIYVRKADNAGHRLLSVRRLPELPPDVALDEGWTIDGNTYFMRVSIDRLHKSEIWLRDKLQEWGYSVDFN